MALQDILYVSAIVLFALAFVFILVAVIVFFVRNIPDVRADLSGKKRAEEVARIDSVTARGHRRGGSRRDANTVAQGNGGVRKVGPAPSSAPAPASVARQPEESPRQVQPQAANVVRVQPVAQAGDTGATTILPADDNATTILPEDSESTTILPADNREAGALPSSHVGVIAPSGGDDGIALDGFHVVRRIVLMDSAEFVYIGQGG